MKIVYDNGFRVTTFYIDDLWYDLMPHDVLDVPLMLYHRYGIPAKLLPERK